MRIGLLDITLKYEKYTNRKSLTAEKYFLKEDNASCNSNKQVNTTKTVCKPARSTTPSN